MFYGLKHVELRDLACASSFESVVKSYSQIRLGAKRHILLTSPKED